MKIVYVVHAACCVPIFTLLAIKAAEKGKGWDYILPYWGMACFSFFVLLQLLGKF